MTLPTPPGGLESPIKSCFVIGPIGDRQAAFGSEERLRYEQAIQIWDYVIQPACDSLGIDPVRADNIDEPGEITEQTFEHLRDDDLVIADLTGGNANVMYELGLRHTKGKLTVQIGEKARLPFDVTVIRTIQFVRNETGLVEARERLVRAISTGAERRGPRPVTATRVWLKLDDPGPEDDEPVEPEGEDDTPGFLELLADMEEALPLLADVQEELTATFEDLSEIAGAVSDNMKRSDQLGGGAGGRLRVARQMARDLEEPANRLEQLAADFVGQLERMDPGISYLIGRMEEEKGAREEEGAREFLEGINKLAEAAGPALASVGEVANIVQPLGQASNRLRPVTRRMSTAIRKIAETSQTIKVWGDRVEAID